MTQSTQKQEEREILRELLSATGIRPECSPVEGEKPDFMIQVSGRTVGVEVTMYRSDKTVAVVGKHAVRRRQVESEWESFERSSLGFRREHAELKDVCILFRFRNIVPPRQKYGVFFQEILQFVRSRPQEVGTGYVQLWGPDFGSPLMIEYLEAICLRRCERGEWDSNVTAGFVDRPARTIAKIVAAKGELAKTYRPASELWLVIGHSGRPSEMVLPISGVSELDASPEIQRSLPFSPFSRVYVFTAMGLFKWDKTDDKWQVE
jgi:hypothetical protein